MKILIVDDNGNERKFLKMNLAEHGISSVIEAQDGVEGLDMARIRRPDLIISDGLMPRMDGFQLLRNIKADETLKHIRFILYSAVYTGDQETELATALGAEAFIVKPKGPEEFWRELSGIIGKKGQRDTNPTPHLVKEDEAFLREYSHVVTIKLEEKVKELSDEIRQRKKMEEDLKKLIDNLRETMSQVKTLSGLLPICACCKKIRDDKGYWNQIENYLKDHAEVEFSHGLCPDCYTREHKKVSERKGKDD